MNPNDYYLEAVRTWQRVNSDLKHFSECCYHVENKLALAADCKCDVRTVQLYAAAWSLYQEMVREFGETVSLLWAEGEISLWRKAPQLRNTYNLSLGETLEYIMIAVNEGMTRDSFAAHVDEKENDTPKWIRRLQNAIRVLTPVKNDWRTEMPPVIRDEFDRLLAEFTTGLQRLEELAERERVE